jgi:hypothetical protein
VQVERPRRWPALPAKALPSVLLAVLACLAVFLLHSACASDSNGRRSSGSTIAPAASSTSPETSPGATTPSMSPTTLHLQTEAEKAYQSETQIMSATMAACEKALYDCFGPDTEQGVSPIFTDASKATVQEVADEAARTWGQWKDKESPSSYYATLHGYVLEYLQHFAAGTSRLALAWQQENTSEVIAAMKDELFAASDAKERAIAEAERIAKEQGEPDFYVGRGSPVA